MAAIRHQTRRENFVAGQALKSINCTCLDLPVHILILPHSNHPSTQSHEELDGMNGWMGSLQCISPAQIFTDGGSKIEETTLSVI